ncbi:hypothetical protein TNCV_4472001 [Trichonephila clavipes]|uniref:Uncharacterized protein n=1 Tax=Trichonephila clavipes TaxID=2585209 RepID=A0A8X6VKZ6_TRICX|nr:hypothetical protein TNCV_4472001 [Trichonephila clavipes]
MTEQLEKLSMDDGTKREPGLISTEPDKLIDTKLSFHMNHALICGIIMAAFIFYAMVVNSIFQSALSNDMLA